MLIVCGDNDISTAGRELVSTGRQAPERTSRRLSRNRGHGPQHQYPELTARHIAGLPPLPSLSRSSGTVPPPQFSTADVHDGNRHAHPPPQLRHATARSAAPCSTASAGARSRSIPAHCLLIETERRAGAGRHRLRPAGRAHAAARVSAALLPRAAQHPASARRRRRCGRSRRSASRPADVRHIVLTHLDFDHAGGIEDFPGRAVHVMEAERDAAEHKRRGFIDRAALPAAAVGRRARLAHLRRAAASAGSASTACAISTACRRRS